MKNSHLDIASIKIAKMFWTALVHKTTFKAAWRLASSGFSEFFIPQFTTLFRVVKRNVVSVDHPLDETIPFRPEYMDTYLGFYPLWIKCMYFLYKEFDGKALPYIRDFMTGVSGLYYEAGTIYRECQSTTERPKYLKTAKFRLIHIVDPHLHCVPSLHVLLVVFNYVNMRRIIDELALDTSVYKEQVDFTYSQAVQITNSILYVKQHSVNCIPAALYVMTNLDLEYGKDQAESFIADLFRDGILENSDELRAFVYERFQFYLESGADRTHQDVLLDFLRGCAPAS